MLQLSIREPSSHPRLRSPTFYMCDVTPRPPRIRQLLRTISLYSRWSTSGSDRGIAHFFTATRNTMEGAGGKKRTNEQYAWVNSSARMELCNTAFPVCIYRLTLAWILAKLQQATMNANLSWPVFLTGLDSLMPTGLSAPVSTGLSRHSSPTPSSSVFVQLSDWCSLPHFRSPEISSPKPLVWFCAKTDKGIVCLVDHLYSVTYVYTGFGIE